MLLLGLTGSIATGKSTVSSILSQPPYSLPIIDADLISRKVVEPGTAGYAAIVNYFGPTTPDLLLPADDPASRGEHGPNGKGRPLNRPALGRRVFGSSDERAQARKVLNGIVHPAVRKEMYRQMVYAYLKGNWAVVLDVPLLFESGWERYCGTIMVVAVKDPAVQMKRLMERDSHLTEEDARNRVLSQGDVREKAERCLRRGPGMGVVVWNDQDKASLRKELDRVMVEIKQKSPQWWAYLLLLCPPLGGLVGFLSFLKSRRIQTAWEAEKRSQKAKL